ncbi:MAG: hypothetical protein U9R15_14960 [Chloroflexota bacterium]|nr:hypothetical protein [Chloroflexota bacterium]
MKEHQNGTTMKTNWPTYKMQAYRVEKIIPRDKALILQGLPFPAGDRVEVLIVRQRPRSGETRYPLRGAPIEYERPFESVVENDWEALR